MIPEYSKENFREINEEAFISLFHSNYKSLCFFANRFVNDPY